MPPRTRKEDDTPMTITVSEPEAASPTTPVTFAMLDGYTKTVEARVNARMDAQHRTLQAQVGEQSKVAMENAAAAADALGELDNRMTKLISDLSYQAGRVDSALEEVRRINEGREQSAKTLARLEESFLRLAVDMHGQSEANSDPEGGPAIWRAVRAVMAAVEGVGKHGEMSDGRQRYSFRAWDDVQNALAIEFRRNSIMLQSEVMRHAVDHRPVGERTWTHVTVQVRYILTSLVDGTTLEFTSLGEGRDLTDKATAKAMTMAAKTFASQAFMLATGDEDPDSERPGDDAPAVGSGVVRRPANETEQQRLAREAYEARRRGTPVTPPAQQPAPVSAADATEQYGQQMPAPTSPNAEQMLEQQLGARPIPQEQPADPWEAYPQQPPAQNPEELRKQQRAGQALAAARAAGLTYDRLNAIMTQAGGEGIANVQIEGRPLKAHLVAIGATLRGAQ